VRSKKRSASAGCSVKKEEIAAAKVRARRKAAIEKAEAALENARRQHDEKAVVDRKRSRDLRASRARGGKTVAKTEEPA
jgi:hypothetical protein